MPRPSSGDPEKYAVRSLPSGQTLAKLRYKRHSQSEELRREAHEREEIPGPFSKVRAELTSEARTSDDEK